MLKVSRNMIGKYLDVKVIMKYFDVDLTEVVVPG